MYIKDGISYAGEAKPLLRIAGVRPMENYRLWVRFSNGEAKVFDFSPLLKMPAFAPLSDAALFRQVYIDYGTVAWQDGDIDISPEYLYDHGVPVEEIA